MDRAVDVSDSARSKPSWATILAALTQQLRVQVGQVQGREVAELHAAQIRQHVQLHQLAVLLDGPLVAAENVQVLQPTLDVLAERDLGSLEHDALVAALEFLSERVLSRTLGRKAFRPLALPVSHLVVRVDDEVPA